MSPRGSGPTAPPSAPVRRPGGEDSASDGGRREGPGGPRGSRPLPQVAAPIVSPPRSGGPPRSSSPAPKSQRPEKSMTRDEMMALMRSGGLNTFQSPASPPGTGQGGRTGQPQRGAGPAGPPRPGTAPQRPRRRGDPHRAPVSRRRRSPRPAVDDEEERKAKSARLGSAADRAGRRAKRNERAGERRVTSPVPAAALLSADEEETRRSRSGKKPRGGHRTALAPTRKSHADLEPPITVRALSEAIGIKASDLLRKLMAMNQLVNINATLEEDLAVMLAMEFGVELQVIHETTPEDEMIEAIAA